MSHWFLWLCLIGCIIQGSFGREYPSLFDEDVEEMMYKQSMGIPAHCNIRYESPVPGAGTWQKPTIPLILIPGIGGSMLHASTEPPKKLWLAYRTQETVGIEYLSSTFDNATEEIVPRFPFGHLVTARYDLHGICSIDNVDPDLILPSKSRYYHILIHYLTSLGYEVGKTLFGYPYDWRNSVRHPRTLQGLHQLIQNTSSLSPTGKVDIISHSMGGLLFKSYLGRYHEYSDIIRKWIPVSTPWLGSGSVGFQAMIKGYNMDIPYIPSIGGFSEAVAKQLELGWPPGYELLPDTSDPIWTKKPYIKYTLNGNLKTIDSDEDVLDFLNEVNVEHEFIRGITGERFPQPFDMNLYRYSKETKRLLKEYGNRIKEMKIEIRNILGIGSDTKFGIRFDENVHRLPDISNQTAQYDFSSGDGTVPRESSISNGMGAPNYIYNGRFDHQKMVEAKEIHNAIRNFLDLSCNVEGSWTVYTRGDPKLMPNFTLEIGPNVKVTKPRSYLTDDYEMAFLDYEGHKGFMKLEKNCLSFAGDIGKGTWIGNRIIGNECTPSQTKVIRDIKNGKVFVSCSYGKWSKSEFVVCDNAYEKTEDDQCMEIN